MLASGDAQITVRDDVGQEIGQQVCAAFAGNDGRR
jgi:hypothetical protein